jgi:hypothetical protein
MGVVTLKGALFKFLVTSNHDTLRQARYLRELHPFVGTMTLAYGKENLNEANPLGRRPDSVVRTSCHTSLIWDSEVPSEDNLRR